MKKTLLSIIIITFSTTLFAIEPVSPPQVGNTPPDANIQNIKPTHGKNELRFAHPNKLLDVTINSDNPEETIKKITSLFPSEKGKQYSVHVSITEFPTVKEEIAPLKDIPEKPAIEENKVQN